MKKFKNGEGIFMEFDTGEICRFFFQNVALSVNIGQQ
jgi:hypothetical protein